MFKHLKCLQAVKYDFEVWLYNHLAAVHNWSTVTTTKTERQFLKLKKKHNWKTSHYGIFLSSCVHYPVTHYGRGKKITMPDSLSWKTSFFLIYFPSHSVSNWWSGLDRESLRILDLDMLDTGHTQVIYDVSALILFSRGEESCGRWWGNIQLGSAVETVSTVGPTRVLYCNLTAT